MVPVETETGRTDGRTICSSRCCERDHGAGWLAPLGFQASLAFSLALAGSELRYMRAAVSRGPDGASPSDGWHLGLDKGRCRRRHLERADVICGGTPSTARHHPNGHESRCLPASSLHPRGLMITCAPQPVALRRGPLCGAIFILTARHDRPPFSDLAAAGRFSALSLGKAVGWVGRRGGCPCLAHLHLASAASGHHAGVPHRYATLSPTARDVQMLPSPLEDPAGCSPWGAGREDTARPIGAPSRDCGASRPTSSSRMSCGPERDDWDLEGGKGDWRLGQGIGVTRPARASGG